MKNKNYFIIFSAIIIVLIIVAFASLIVAANDNIKIENDSSIYNNLIRTNIKPKSNKVKILIDPGIM